MLTGTKTMKAGYYPHADRRGTTYKVTDENGDVVWSGLTDAFGKEIASSGTNPSIFWFQGQACFRKEIGGRVYYISPTRIYDATDGRYLQRDPVGKIGGPNLYQYAKARPTALVDPLGLMDHWPGPGWKGMLSNPDDPDAPAVWIAPNGERFSGTTTSINGPLSASKLEPELKPKPEPEPKPEPKPKIAPGAKQKGEALGEFLVTAYNIAHEADHPDEPKIVAKGLNRKYSKPFLRDIIMQGSGADKKERLIQIDWIKSKRPFTPERTVFRYVETIRGAAGRSIQSEVSIAVDPSVIPSGTWVFIDTVGWRRADDTGGKIKGKHIDLFMPVSRREALVWGRKKLCVWKEKGK